MTAVRQLISTKSSPIDLGDVLGDEHVGLAVAVEVAEADVPARAEVGRLELLPELRLRVLGLRAGQLSVSRCAMRSSMLRLSRAAR